MAHPNLYAAVYLRINFCIFQNAGRLVTKYSTLMCCQVEKQYRCIIIITLVWNSVNVCAVT